MTHESARHVGDKGHIVMCGDAKSYGTKPGQTLTVDRGRDSHRWLPPAQIRTGAR
jgi:hypothetical protein